MSRHARKMMAPILIVLGLVGYYVAMSLFLLNLEVSNTIKVIAIIFAVIISIAFIWVLVERIKEIRKGEEDDLGKY